MTTHNWREQRKELWKDMGFEGTGGEWCHWQKAEGPSNWRERLYPTPPPEPVTPEPAITLGQRMDGSDFLLPLKYMENSHGDLLASSNRGKSKTMEVIIHDLLQMENPSQGGLVLDVEATLIRSLVKWMAHQPNAKELAKKVIIVSPSLAQRTGLWPAINPFATSKSLDIGVQTKHLTSAIAKSALRGGSDSYEMPTFQRVAKMLIRVGLEAGLFMGELRYLNPLNKGAKPVRAKLAQKVSSQWLKDDLAILEAESAREQKSDTLSFYNRFSSFMDVEAITLMMDREMTLDWEEIVEQGQWVLVDLSEDEGLLDAQDGYLLGSLILSQITDYVLKRTDKQAKEKHFFVFCDEFQTLIHPDLITACNRLRKRSVHFFFAHQNIVGIEEDDPKLMNAVITNTDVKIYMGVNDPRDAKRAEEIIFAGTHNPLAVKDEISNPTVVELQDVEVVTNTTSEARAEAKHKARTTSWGSSTMRASGSMSGSSNSSGYGGGMSGGMTRTMMPDGSHVDTSMDGHSDAWSDSSMDMEAETFMEGESDTEGESEMEGSSSSIGAGKATAVTMQQRSILEDRANSRNFYSVDDQRVLNQAKLHGLEPQYAYVRLRTNHPVLVKIATVEDYPEDQELVEEFEEAVMEAHDKYYLAESQIYRVIEERKVALEAPPEEATNFFDTAKKVLGGKKSRPAGPPPRS